MSTTHRVNNYDRMYSSMNNNELGGYLSRVNKIQTYEEDRAHRYGRNLYLNEDWITQSRPEPPTHYRDLAHGPGVVPYVLEEVPAMVVTRRTTIYAPDCTRYTERLPVSCPCYQTC
jgi:hypothetical protein